MTGSRKLRNSVSGIALAVAAGMAASSAQAATTTIDDLLEAQATGWVAIGANLENIAGVTATILNAVGEVIATDLGDGDAPSSVTVDGSLIGAFGAGNSFSNEVELEVINEGAPDTTGGVGIGVATAAINSGVVDSSVTGSALTIDLTNAIGGSMQNVDNLITAETTGNRGDTLVHGAVPNGYASETAGDIAFDSANIGVINELVLTSEATIAVTSAQQNTADASGSQARVDGNAIIFSNTPTADADFTASPAVDRNAITALYRGNTANSTISVESGEDPTFTGSAALANLQANEGVATDGANALNQESTIAAIIGDPGATAGNHLTGSLSVSDNAISASAFGNEAVAPNGNGGAGNQILLEPGLNFQGTGSPGGGGALEYDSGAVEATVSADLGLLNHQSNVDSPVSAVTSDASIAGQVQSIEGGAVDISGNTVRSQAGGNAAGNRILAPGLEDGTNSLVGTAALVSGQVNHASPVTATTEGVTIGLMTGLDANDFGADLNDGAITVDGNAVSAGATGNQAGNSLALTANTLDLGGDLGLLSGGFQDDVEGAAFAGASVLNVQANYAGTEVSASTDDVRIGVLVDDDIGGVDDSAISVAGNAVTAIGAGSSASNILALDGNTLRGAAGLASLQAMNAGSVSASVTDALIAAYIDDDVDATTVSVVNNRIQALAHAGNATNTVLVEANNTGVGVEVSPPNVTGPASLIQLDLAELADDGLIFDNDPDEPPRVTATYGLYNNQNSSADVTATVASEDPNIGILVADDVASSALANDGNAVAVSANGAQSSNAMDLALGNLTVEGGAYAPIGNITNVQTQGADVQITGTVTSADNSTISTLIGGDVDGSTVTVSDNAIQASAYGNRASSGGADAVGNRLTVSGNTLEVVPDSALNGLGMSFGTGADSLGVDAAFSIQNAQSGADLVEAALVDTGVLLSIGEDILSSTVAADGNAFLGTAINNQALNELALDATTLATSSGIQNFQLVGSETRAVLGQPGLPPTPAGDPTTITGSITGTVGGSDSLSGDGTLTIADQSSITLDIGSITDSDERALIEGFLSDLGFTINGNDAEFVNNTGSPATFDFSDFTDHALNGSAFSASGVTFQGDPADPGQAASPSVVIAIGGNSGDIIDSSVTILDTQTFATAIGNDAGNDLSVSATNMAPGAGLGEAGTASLEIPDFNDPAFSADVTADHAVNSVQVLLPDGVTVAEAYSTLGIQIVADDQGDFGPGFTAIENSSLDISGSRQQAQAIGNRAGSLVQLAATNTGAEGEDGVTASLFNGQYGDLVAVNAISESEIYAPGAMANSTLNLSGNTNNAIAGVNQADNAMAVTGTNIASASLAENATANVEWSDGGIDAAAVADFTVFNAQVGEDAALTATAATSIFNQELGAATANGLSFSSVALNGNRTVAQATINEATNSLSLDASSNLAATGAALNGQWSSGTVTANASGELNFALNSTTAPTVESSTISAGNNTVAAAAAGNRATNDLAATAGAGYGNLSGAGASSSTSDLGNPALESVGVSASYAVLNSQHNAAAVSASTTGAVTVALNGGTASTVGGSSLSLSNNAFQASAVGNAATNRLTVGATPGGNPSAAITNAQRNTGDVTATASNVAVSLTAGGPGVTGSASALSANGITASATGNSVVNRIRAAR